ncbi:Fungal lipase-like domain [Sesbania bispinosa]|nr:Fungal lipase-like domain [Sesbania bispinosa]
MGAFRRLGRKYGLRLSQKLRDWFDGRPASAPRKAMDLIFILAEASVLIYSETVDMWPLFDLVKAILFLMFNQDNVPLASVYGGNGCQQLEAPKIIQDLGVPRLLELCLLLSKKPFPEFLHSAGFSQDDVVVWKTKARTMKPSFAIVCDVHSKCFLVLIRGTHSIQDVLTDATCAAQSFECSVLRDDGTMEEVSGHVHKGMVGAAWEIAKECTPILLEWLAKNPNFKVKVFYILKSREEASSLQAPVSHLAQAPACMTLSLAESGKHFITTIINGSDLVPTFSTCSVHDLLSEVITNSSGLTGSTRKSRARFWVDRLGDILKQIASDIQLF